MTHRIAAMLLFAAVSLSACATLDADAAYTDATCRTVMYGDPGVKAAMRGLGQQNTQLGADSLVRDAKQDAYGKCLRENGLAPKGGVERVKRNWL